LMVEVAMNHGATTHFYDCRCLRYYANDPREIPGFCDCCGEYDRLGHPAEAPRVRPGHKIELSTT
jgi:hypothetical protein